jgi:hypothetical protein
MNKRNEVFNSWQSKARRDLKKLIKKEIRYFSKNNSTFVKSLDLKIDLKKKDLPVRNATKSS